jgi:glyoxylase-like metal-dependent hydrolase (beta-lactamase superfamily II)
MGPSEALPGLWRFEALHPEWTEDDGSEEGWDPVVAWWAIKATPGLLLIDPLVFAWDELDHLVEEHDGCAGVVRTLHWHQRSVAEAAARYGAGVWAGPVTRPETGPPDHELADGAELSDGILAFSLERDDEIALWLPAQSALVFADAMLRTKTGELRVCPESWTQPQGGPARLRATLSRLSELRAEHVLVSHGPLILGDGVKSLRAALA